MTILTEVTIIFMKQIINELNKYSAYSYWWNMGTKKKDFSGNLGDLLADKSMKIKKVKDSKHPDLDCYVVTTPHRVTLKHFGSAFDAAFLGLKLWYATMGDKATLNVAGRTFTVNHNR